MSGDATACFPTPSKGSVTKPPTLPLVQGTLDLLVLRALASGPMHGYGIATLVHERTGGHLAVEDAALYQALHRLDRQGLVDAEWRPSENNRRARYYTLTPGGRQRLREETANWRRYSRAVEAVLAGV
jgi:PadR family transcriptional regulator PadR